MKRYIVLMSFLIMAINLSFGQYVWSGGTISSSVTWSGYDYYYIDGDINITTGGTLTIVPNTTGNNPVYVVFRGGTGIKYGIYIDGSGTLNVNGTSSRNIFFTADKNDNGTYGETGETWKNLSFDGPSSTSLIEYAVIEYGTGDLFHLGGGIDIYGCNITVRNTTIRNCHISDTDSEGGGIWVQSAGYNVSLQNLVIHDNSSGLRGGGLFIDGNININNCEIYSNSSPSGDGVYLNSTCTISNSLIYNNTSGEGVYVNSSGASLSNCLVYGNTTGVYFIAAGNIVNCDVIKNSTGIISASFNAPKVVNSVLWGNTSAQYNIISGNSLELDYCGIQGGSSGGIYGIHNRTLSSTNGDDTGPNFVNESTPDLHINAVITPLVDGGTTSYSGVTIPTADREGHSRLNATDIGAFEFLYYIWTGATDSDWSESGNWTGSLVPALTISENQVIIPTGCLHYPEIASLTLSSRSRMTIGPQAGLTVTGATIVNTGCTFLLQSDANGSANFITGSSVNGSINVQMFLAGGGGPAYKWHYVTTPVDGIGKEVLTTNISNINNLVNYYEPGVTTDKNTGWQWHNGLNGTSGFANLSSTKGYNVYVATDQTALFSGQILSDQSVSWGTMLTCTGTVPSQAGWNLIGNPFTSGVNVELFSIGNDIDKTIYYTSNNGYPVWNILTQDGTGSKFIPALQGFFVHARSGRARTLTIPSSSRYISKSSLYKGDKEIPDYPILKFNISDAEALTDIAIIYFFKDATTAFDGDYDAYKILSGNQASPQIYTTSNNVQLAMNGLPYPESKTIVPLNLRIGEAKNYTINVLALRNLNDYNVYLVHGDKKIDLKTNPSYSFYAASGVLTDMSIAFESLSTDVNIPSEYQTSVWYLNGNIMIKAGERGFENNTLIVIHDLNGKVVYSKSNISLVRGDVTEIPVSLAKGMYIISMINNYTKSVKKIVIPY